MGQDKLFELLAIQFCRNPLPMLAFHHFQPQKDGDFRGLARPQQKTQKDLSHQRPKDKFNQSEKPATSSRNSRHAAVIRFASQPAEKHALQQFRVEAVGFGAPVFT
jgi:hypothetical protein